MNSTIANHRPLPDATRVEALAGFGLDAGEIALLFNMDETSLRDQFPNELSSGQIKANARVAESLYRKAIGEGRESVIAAIFWLKTRARWKETSGHELSTNPASPLTFNVTYETDRHSPVKLDIS